MDNAISATPIISRN